MNIFPSLSFFSVKQASCLCSLCGDFKKNLIHKSNKIGIGRANLNLSNIARPSHYRETFRSANPEVLRISSYRIQGSFNLLEIEADRPQSVPQMTLQEEESQEEMSICQPAARCVSTER